MKKLIIVLFCIIFSSCKKNNEEQKLIYKQLIHYRDELKMNSKAIESYVAYHTKEEKYYKDETKNFRDILIAYEKIYEKLKFKERDKIVKLRDSFNDKYKLFQHFDTSIYGESVSDTIFNRLMEIDFYKSKIAFQNRYLIRHGCKFYSNKYEAIVPQSKDSLHVFRQKHFQ